MVQIAGAKPADPFPRAASLVGDAVTVWPGISQADMQRVIQPVESVAVLELR